MSRITRRDFAIGSSLLVPAISGGFRAARAAPPEWPNYGTPVPKAKSPNIVINDRGHYVLPAGTGYNNLTIKSGASGRSESEYTIIRVAPPLNNGNFAKFSGTITIEANVHHVWLWGLEARHFEIEGQQIVLRRCRGKGRTGDTSVFYAQSTSTGLRMEYCEATSSSSSQKPVRGIQLEGFSDDHTFIIDRCWVHGIAPTPDEGGGMYIGDSAIQTERNISFTIENCLIEDVERNYLLELKAGYFNAGAPGTGTNPVQGTIRSCTFIGAASGPGADEIRQRQGGGNQWLGNYLENTYLDLRGAKHVVAGNKIAGAKGQIRAATGNIRADKPDPSGWPTNPRPNCIDSTFYNNDALVVIGATISNGEPTRAGLSHPDKVRGNKERANTQIENDLAEGTTQFVGTVQHPIPRKLARTEVGPLAGL